MAESNYTSLLDLKQNCQTDLDTILKNHSDSDPPRGIFITSYYSAMNHHNLAILNVLLNADIESFCDHLYKASRCKRYYLLKVLSGMKIEDGSYVAATEDFFFFDAIVSGYEDAPLLISRTMSEIYNNTIDSAERFAFSTLMRILIDPDPSEVLFQENEKAMASANMNDNRLKCALAIKEKNEVEFNTAFHKLIQERSDEVKAGSVSNEPDCHIFIEGLAILRIAKKYNIKSDFSSSMVPKNLLYEPKKDAPENEILTFTQKEIDIFNSKFKR